ncbi:hypothetical protein BC835DRAFT_1315820 [Cytidiella melzeri]|nr:hypothetical protein BC835DRAFT_1315820 [Cytidiella melzeri]
MRLCFHKLATREAVGQNMAVVCWVDSILAKMGEAAQCVFSSDGHAFLPSSSLDATPSRYRTLSEHREERALQAALQLPHTLPQVMSTIGSTHASAAAIRLAVRIMFSAIILQSPVGVNRLWPFPCAHSTLQTFICERGLDIALPDHDVQALEDRTTIAMAISMFATFDCSELDQSPSPFRPHMLATVLRQIECVLVCSETESQSLTSAEPLRHLDPAQKVLICWGMVVPWCWVAWSDERIVDYNVIQLLTTTWLFHLGDFAQVERTWEEQLELCMAHDPVAAFSFLLTLIRRTSETLLELGPSSNRISLAALQVLFRCCWGIKELLGVFDVAQEPLIRQGASILCILFALLQHSSEELAVKDCIVAALTHVQPGILLDALHEMVEDLKLGAKTRLDANASAINCKLVKNIRSKHAALETADIHNLQQIFQLITLVWQVDGSIDALFNRKTVASLFRNALSRLSFISQCDSVLVDGSTYADSFSSELDILYPLLTTLAAMELARRRSPAVSDFGVGRLREMRLAWEVAVSEVDPDDVVMMATFSSFVVAAAEGERECINTLKGAAAWDILRDYVLLVAQGQSLGTPDELLSFAICPTVFEAMGVLIEAVPGIIPYITTSPWTQSLCQCLTEFPAAVSTKTDNYQGAIKEALKPLSLHLKQQVAKHMPSSQSQPRMEAQSQPTRSTSLRHIYYWPQDCDLSLSILLLA